MPTTIETLTLPNFLDANILEELKLSADAAAAALSFSVFNPDNIAPADYVVLSPGLEKGELRKIDAGGVTGNVVTTTLALSLQHRNGERVIKLYGNKIKVFRAPNVDGNVPADDQFTLLGSVTIDADQPFSYYTDAAGGTGFWYKFVYFNDVTSGITDLSLSEAIRGGGYGHYVSLGEIKAEAGLDQNRRFDPSEVAQRRVEAESEVKGVLAAAGYILPLQMTSGAGFVPALISGVTRLLAAGLILQQNYGTTKVGDSKNGKLKSDAARATLDRIAKNKIVLLDSNEQMLSKPSLVSGWPDETTKDVGTDGVHGEPAKATMSKVF